MRLGSRKARLEEVKAEEEIKLLEAKTAAIESAQKVEAMYAEAIKAFATPKNNLNWPDGGEAGGSHKQTTAEQFGEWFGQVTNQS